VLVGLGALALLSKTPPPLPVKPVSTSATTPPDRSIHLNYFGVRTEWRKLAGGSVLEAEFAVVNVHKFPVKDIKLSCALYAPSGTAIGSKLITLYETFLPSTSPTLVKNMNLGFIDQQVSRVSCDVDSAIAAP
jgi:hypothetical protein